MPETNRKTRSRGRFIVLDGPDGAGKTTQIQLLAGALKQRGIDVLLLREPGGTSAGESIRQILLESRGSKDHLSPLAEAFLFQAARAQLCDEVIRPALSAGKWVLCDRFTLSTLAYQGYAGGLGPKIVETLSSISTGKLKPDRYLVLWVDTALGLARRAARTADRMESKGDAFLKAVAAAYRKVALRSPRTYRLIDGAAGLDEVRARIWNHVEPLL